MLYFFDFANSQASQDNDRLFQLKKVSKSDNMRKPATTVGYLSRQKLVIFLDQMIWLKGSFQLLCDAFISTELHCLDESIARMSKALVEPD